MSRVQPPGKPCGSVFSTPLAMNTVDGAQLFRRMQRNALQRRIPVVLMSSAPVAPSNAKLPWAMFLQKPFEFGELTSWLRKHVGGGER